MKACNHARHYALRKTVEHLKKKDCHGVVCSSPQIYSRQPTFEAFLLAFAEGCNNTSAATLAAVFWLASQ